MAISHAVFIFPLSSTQIIFTSRDSPRGADRYEVAAKEQRFAIVAQFGGKRVLAIHKKAGRAAHKLAKRVRLSVWGVFVFARESTMCWGWVCPSLVIFHECMHPGSLCVIDRLCAKSVQAVAAAATATARMARGGSRRQIQLHTHTHIHTIRTQSAVEFLDRHLHGAAAPPRLLPSSDRPSIATPFQFVRLFCSKRTPDNARAGQILEELVFNEQLVEKGFASQLVS
jgi:hypothetical protein